MQFGAIQIEDAMALSLLDQIRNGRIYRAQLTDGNIGLFTYSIESEWIDVFARLRCKSDAPGSRSGAYKCYGWNVDRQGFLFGGSPAGAKEIRAILKHLEQMRSEDIMTQPSSLIEGRDKVRATEALTEALEEAERLATQRSEGVPCYVCGDRLPLPDLPLPGTVVVCPSCEIRNVITSSGRANRPERMAVYIKYDGDFHEHTPSGLVHQTENMFETERGELRRRLVLGEFTEPEYRSLAAKLARRRTAAIEQLENQKRAELDPLKNEEKAILACRAVRRGGK